MSSVKNYYDMLGVRPHAKLPEIELAYKGRRTQYHPDKYANADAETIRWATEQMQGINEAYAVLSNPEERCRYDRSRDHVSAHSRSSDTSDTRRPPGAGSSFAAGSEDAGDAPLLLDYLQELPLNAEDAERFHMAPHIPRQKLIHALSCRSFYANKPPGRVDLLIDDTVFQGGAEGLVVTDEIISFKALFMDSVDYVYAKGWNGEFTAKGSTLHRFGKECHRFSLISASAVHLLTWALNRYFADRFQWHVMRAVRGDVESQFILSCSCHGEPEEELRWLTLAAENGHVGAQHNLGMHYLHTNRRLAFEWLSRAAASGSSHAARRLRSEFFKNPP